MDTTSLKVSDYYSLNVPKLEPQSSINDVLNAFLKYRMDVACIIDKESHLFGIISKYSIYRAILEGKQPDSPIESFIKRDVATININDPFEYARNKLIQRHVAHGIVCDDNGNVVGVIGKGDIIQGFYHEKELLLNQLSGLVEQLKEAVITIDEEKNILIVNKASENMFQLKKEEVIGFPIEQFFPEISVNLKEILKENEKIKAPFRMNIKQHSVIASFMPITYEHRVNGAMAVLQDITHVEEIAQELEITKNLHHTLQHALAISYDAIMIVNQNGIISMVNKAFLQLIEKNHEEVINHHWSIIVPELYLDKVLVEQHTENQAENQVRNINSHPCFIVQEPIIRDEEKLGMIVKIIFKKLDEWRDIFHRLEQLENELHHYRKEFHHLPKKATAFDIIVSIDPVIDNLKQKAYLAAKNTSTVLITGESGTGKELFAEALHHESERKGRFIKVNCAAIPDELIESEFFGYVEGSFTGARKGGKPGKFELADKGTLFLDEIGDMPISLQSKLLRVLQEKTFERIGDINPINTDVRIIAATNQDLKKMVKKGTMA